MSRIRGGTPEFRALIEAAHRAGWRVERRPGGHLCFTPADRTKPQVYASFTASDVRAVKNCRARLRRSGLDV